MARHLPRTAAGAIASSAPLALFLKAARQIDVRPERCVVVEDAVPGVEAAARAGMKCIAVTTTNPAQALIEADVVVERPDELPPDIIKQLLWT